MNNTQPVVILTGGSMGLGFELSKELLRLGFSVITCARRETELHRAIDALSKYGNVTGIAGDVCDPNVQDQLVDLAIRQFGRIDALINNASTLGPTPLKELELTTLEEIRQVYEVNTFAPLSLTQKCLPHLLGQTSCLVLGITSDAAIGAYPAWGSYGSSKLAFELLHKTLAAEHPRGGMTVYTVDPGDMATEMHEAAIPGDTNLALPSHVASSLSVLFRDLRDGTLASHPSGSRLQVKNGSLVRKEWGE